MRFSLVLLGLGLAGCVAAELAEVERAQRAYDACIAEYGDDPECEPLAERVRQAEERYQGGARRAWGCDPAIEDCPTPR